MEFPSKTETSAKYACWKNGKMITPEQSVVSIYDHGFLYGDGCFEGLRFYNRNPFRLDRHLKRLRRSLKALDIKIQYSDDDIRKAISECIANSALNDGYLRILVTRGEGDMGLNPQNCRAPNVFIIPALLSLVNDNARREGVRLITSSIRRAVGTGLDPRVKSLNYLHSILARAEANAAGVEEAILLNQFGTVAECSAENIFIVNGGVLFTPPVNDGALEGITREAIIEISHSIGIQISEMSLTQYDLYNADECFICGSGARLIPVKSIDGRPIATCPGNVFNIISIHFQSLIDEECEKVADEAH